MTSSDAPTSGAQSSDAQSSDAPTPAAPAASQQDAAPARAEARPVGAADRAVTAVFSDVDAAERAVTSLAEQNFPLERVSLVAKEVQSPDQVNGFVSTGDSSTDPEARGSWSGGLFGLLDGAAVLFIPGAGTLVVLGPLSAGAVGVAEGVYLGGSVGALLGHFIVTEELSRYESLVDEGNALLVVHGTEEEVDRAEQVLTAQGSTDVQRHDEFRGPIGRIGPIEKVFEGMRVVDSAGNEVGKVEFVKMGDPEAVSITGQDRELMPDLPSPFATRLLRVGYVKVDRKGLFARDAYVAASEIDRVEDNTVYLNIPKDMLLLKQ
jgi:hypothetical protein